MTADTPPIGRLPVAETPDHILADRIASALDSTDGIAAVVQLVATYLEEHRATAMAESALRVVLREAVRVADNLAELKRYFHARAADQAPRATTETVEEVQR